MPELSPLQDLGRRIAQHRNALGWTQQELAERLGISRVAVSYLEAGTSVPSERTVALLAGVFKLEPHDLVAGTSYPIAKSDRLPLVAARYTEAELQVRLLARDLEWLARIEDPGLVTEVLGEWRARLDVLLAGSHDLREREALRVAVVRVGQLRPG